MRKENLKISDFDYELPAEKIAKFPLSERDGSKLLVYNGEISTSEFRRLPEILERGELMIFNNTKVVRARLYFQKPSGARIEVFVLEPCKPSNYEENFAQTAVCSWRCLVGNAKRWKAEILSVETEISGEKVRLQARKTSQFGGEFEVEFSWDKPLPFADVLGAFGKLPIPPYLCRESQLSDEVSYQTIYSLVQGSVAAPTAGLHFTERVLADLAAKGVETQSVTLHVGAGTFRPVKQEDVSQHEMHTEHFCVTLEALEAILAHEAKVVAVGTTSVRTIESLYFLGQKLKKNANLTEKDFVVSQWEPYESENKISSQEALEEIVKWLKTNNLKSFFASTQIMIVPGYEFHYVKKLLTNFHQPKSTLLLLVSAFVGEDWRRIYDYALENEIRFLSYGDSSLLIPKC